METCEYCARAERYGLLAAEWRVQPQRGYIYQENVVNGLEVTLVDKDQEHGQTTGQ